MEEVQSPTKIALSTLYDTNSCVQLTANQRHEAMLAEALQLVDKSGETLSVADFGSATGLNSMKAFTPALKAFRKTSESAVFVYHCDLPSNPWSMLFDHAISSPYSYLSLPNTYFAGIGRSYHHRLFPAESLSLGYITYSLHWLSSKSHVPDQMGLFVEGDSSLHSELKTLSDADLNRFISHRSVELKPGGRLLLHMIGGPVTRIHSSYSALLRMQTECLISPALLHHARIPVYYTSPDAVKAAVASCPSLRLTSMSVIDSYDDMYQQFLEDGDRELFAKRMIGSNRALSENVIADLLSKEEGDKQSLLETYYQYVETALRERPAPLKSQEIEALIDKVG